jgi:hypothetical protein
MAAEKEFVLGLRTGRCGSQGSGKSDMAKPSNGKIERHYFEQFAKIFVLPDGCIVYGDKPDVVIRGVRKIGIEITNLFVQSGNLPESEQRQRPLRERVIAEAHKLYLADGGRKLKLTFCFDTTTPISPARMKALSKDLAQFARSCDSQDSGKIHKHLFRGTTPEIRSIYVDAKDYADAKWRTMQVHSLGLMSKDDLKAVVRANESKSGDYEMCDVYWLLVVVDGIDAAQEQEVRTDDPHVSSSVFQRVIVFHTFGHIVEVTAV